MLKNQRCGDCRYCEPEKEKTGICRYGPPDVFMVQKPKPLVNQVEISPVSVYKPVKLDDRGCGRFEREHS